MEYKTKFNTREWVWISYFNGIHECIIESIIIKETIESFNVDYIVSSIKILDSWLTIKVPEQYVFKTKEELIDSLNFKL